MPLEILAFVGDCRLLQSSPRSVMDMLTSSESDAVAASRNLATCSRLPVPAEQFSVSARSRSDPSEPEVPPRNQRFPHGARSFRIEPEVFHGARSSSIPLGGRGSPSEADDAPRGQRFPLGTRGSPGPLEAQVCSWSQRFSHSSPRYVLSGVRNAARHRRYTAYFFSRD